MSALDEPSAKRIAKLLQLLASDFDSEVLNAARRMKRVLAAEQLSFDDIAPVDRELQRRDRLAQVQRNRCRDHLRRAVLKKASVVRWRSRAMTEIVLFRKFR